MNFESYRNNVAPHKMIFYDDFVVPNAVVLEGFNPKYNCESFALHNSTTEWKWTNQTFETLAEMGFKPVKASITRQGDLVVVENGENIRHFCRVVEPNPKIGRIRVISKFGQNELAICNLENAIGGGYGTTVTFLRQRKES